MHQAIKITDKVFWVGANDRTTDLFEGLWPLPRGVSYNSYLIKADKVALVDTVKEAVFGEFLSKIRAVLGESKKIDYLIINHMEPDHSGAIKELLHVYPDIKIVVNKKTTEFLSHFYNIQNNLVTIGDGETLDLGGATLKFFITPMVHWPETMMTYLESDKMLFSGDAFGGFGALDGGIFDDEVDIAYFEDEILRYFSNIVGKYSQMVSKALAKLVHVDIKIIASTHGPVWRKNPSWIIDRYDRFSRHDAEEGVVIAYASMYGNTEKMMEAVAAGLSEEDVSRVRIHNVSKTHVSYLIRDAWRFRAIILGSPTYDANLFPLVENFIQMLEQKKLSRRLLGLFGTYAWSGGGVKRLQEFAKSDCWRLVEPVVEARCSPTEEDLKKCFELGQNIVKELKNKREEIC